MAKRKKVKSRKKAYLTIWQARAYGYRSKKGKKGKQSSKAKSTWSKWLKKITR